MLTVRYEKLGLRPGERLLDLGCGAGRHTYEAMKLGAFVVAADLDAGVLKEVRDVAAAVQLEMEERAITPLGSVTCTAVDALHLPFDDGSFDRIIVSEVFEHIPAADRAMEEVARVLRPGGALVATVPRFWPERICWALSERYHSKQGGHVRIFHRRDLFAQLRSAGFEITSSHHAHALHAPYWWLKCAVGVDDEDHPLVRAYRRFLEWDIERSSLPARALEAFSNPVLGKSLVVYAERVAT